MSDTNIKVVFFHLSDGEMAKVTRELETFGVVVDPGFHISSTGKPCVVFVFPPPQPGYANGDDHFYRFWAVRDYFFGEGYRHIIEERQDPQGGWHLSVPADIKKPPRSGINWAENYRRARALWLPPQPAPPSPPPAPHPEPAPEPQQFRLLDLPAELRLKVFRQTFPDTIRWHEGHRRNNPGMALLKVSPTVRAEYRTATILWLVEMYKKGEFGRGSGGEQKKWKRASRMFRWLMAPKHPRVQAFKKLVM
jgi:hypothetical protein